MIFDRNTINKQGIVSYILVPAIIIRNYPNNSSSPLVQREFLAASLLLTGGSTTNPRLLFLYLRLLPVLLRLPLLILECVDDRSRSSSLFFLYNFAFSIFIIVSSSAPSLLLSLSLAVIQSGPTPGRTAGSRCVGDY